MRNSWPNLFVAKMFSHENNTSSDYVFTSPVRSPYTRSSFTELLRFLQCRVNVDWNKVFAAVFDALAPSTHDSWGPSHPMVQSDQDLGMQFKLSEVWSGYIPSGPTVYSQLSTYDLGVLKYKNAPDPCAIVVTIPRSKLQPIYDKIGPGREPTSVHFQLALCRKNRIATNFPLFSSSLVGYYHRRTAKLALLRRIQVAGMVVRICKFVAIFPPSVSVYGTIMTMFESLLLWLLAKKLWNFSKKNLGIDWRYLLRVCNMTPFTSSNLSLVFDARCSKPRPTCFRR